MTIDDLETPAVIVDLDIMSANIGKMQSFLSAHGIACRPHVKTHKIPAIAHLQLRAGAMGITCQKLSEAEVMVNAGITDILIPYNIVGPAKLDRLARLVRQATVRVTVDSVTTLEGLSATMHRESLTLPVLIECDLGAGRCGVQSLEELVDLARRIERLPGVEFEGLMTFKGGSADIEYMRRTGQFFEQAVFALRRDGISVRTVSVGGTVYAYNAWPRYAPFGVTECRPGVYVYNDRVKIAQGVATLEECAMRVVCTVVSRPVQERAIIDGGSKTFTVEGAPWVEGYGFIVEFPEATMPRMSEEHGILDVSLCARRPVIGDRVTVIPNYVNSVTAASDLVYGVRHGRVEAVWPVAARAGTR